VSDHPVHPDREELAAWQAGALAEPVRTRIGTHLAGCAECAAAVSAVEVARAALATLQEPELPPGLHERIAAVIEQEAAMLAPAAATGLAPATIRSDRRAARPRRRPWVWRRQVAALSAAAALVLLVAGLVPVLRHVGGGGGQGSGGATASRSERTPGAAAPNVAGQRGGVTALPEFDAPGGYSGTRLRAAVASDAAVRDAYARAGRPIAPNAGGGSAGSTDKGLSAQSAPTTEKQQACLAQVGAKTSERLHPAFFVETVYQGRPATVLVTRSPSAPDQAELWAFPRGDCSKAPFASEQVWVRAP
jgi:hypothetical protein